MRHTLSNVLLAALVTFLLLMSVAFAWVRSEQFAITRSPVVVQYRVLPEELRGVAFDWEAIGRRAYVANCQQCHAADGSGWDQYPGLERSAEFALTPEGRDYLIDLHLHGLTSDRWRAPMPAFRTLSDEEIAAVLNYIIEEFSDEALAEGELFVPRDVQTRRDRTSTPREVNEMREALE